MTLTKTPVTGPLLLPDGSVPVNGRVTLRLSAVDTSAGSVVLPGRMPPITLDTDGQAVSPFAGLWPNTDGLRGTHYKGTLTHQIIGRNGLTEDQDVILPNFQVGDAATYTWADLFDIPVPAAPGNYLLLTAEALAVVEDSTNAAEASAVTSEAEADRSQAAADAAAASAVLAGVYGSTALGLAETAIGESFAVAVTGGIAIYLHEAGPVATLVGVVPDASRVTGLEGALGVTPSTGDWNFALAWLTGDPNDPATRMLGMFDRQGRFGAQRFRFLKSSVALGDMNLVYGIGDVKGRYAIGITPTGRVRMERHNERRYTRPAGSDRPQAAAFWTDIHAERAALAVYSDGTIGFQPDRATAGRIAAKASEGLTLADISATVLPGNLGSLRRAGVDLWEVWSDTTGVMRPYLGRGRVPQAWLPDGRDPIILVPKTGESTNEGSQAFPVRQSVPPAPNTAFMAGTLRGHGDRTFAPGMARGLLPALDAVEATVLGSTGLAACGALIEAMSPASDRRPHVFGTHGRSGEYIGNIQSGSVYFTNFLTWLDRMKALLAEYKGRKGECRAVGLTIGANNRTIATDGATFQAGIVSLQASYQSAINAALGQTGEVALFIDQLGAARLASGTGISASQIAQAQLDSALGDAGVYLYLAKYILPYASTGDNNVHFSALGTDLMGEYLGKALYRHRVHSATRFCPMPDLSGISIVGNVVTLPVDLVPVPGVAGQWFGLTSSTELVEAATNLGFAATGTRTITSTPTITDSGATSGTATIQVTLSGAPAGGDALEYAYTGTADHPSHACAWGNVHDLDTQASVTDAPRILRNPLPAFRKVLA